MPANPILLALPCNKKEKTTRMTDLNKKPRRIFRSDNKTTDSGKFVFTSVRNILPVITVICICYSCTPSVAKIDNSLKRYFDSAQVTGSFAIFNNQRGDVTVYNIGVDTQRYAPGSIFKIAETLIGVETSRLTTENAVLRTTDSNLSRITLKDAFRLNNTDFFRALDSIVGEDNMKFWLDSLQYGNASLSTPGNFWEDGQLKISPDEQLGLMFKLYFDKLPFQKHAQSIVRDLMLQDDNTQYKLSYTTGTAVDNGNKTFGWLTGWIEENRHVYFFTTTAWPQNDNGNLDEILIELTKAILTSQGFFKGLN